MSLTAFNRMRRDNAMKAENIKKQKEEKEKQEVEIVETSFEEKREEKTTLGPRKRKADKE